jgi:hypothetical protein
VIRAAAILLFLVGAVAFFALVTNDHPALGFAALIASSSAALVTCVTAFMRDPGDWPDDVPRFPPD